MRNLNNVITEMKLNSDTANVMLTYSLNFPLPDLVCVFCDEISSVNFY